jgi:hypothetical protein
MHEDPDAIIEEWKQLSTNFEDSLEIEFLDEEDMLEVVCDSEL